jgi:hypothetical protein
MQHQEIVRLYADHDGESHFEDIDVALDVVDFAPPAPPLNLAALFDATSCSLVGAPADWGGDVPHPSPRRQLFALLSGTMDVTASDGETRRFPAGSLLLFEDTTGDGHTTKIIEDAMLLSVALNSSFGVPESG